MRKATIAMLLLLVISIGGVCVAAAGVHGPHDQVVLKEKTVYGNREYAEGLDIQIQASYASHLFWDTTYSTGTESQAETDFLFSARKIHDEVSTGYQGIMLDNQIGYFYEPSEEEAHGVARAYRELAEKVPAGQERETTIYLKDYIDTYPMTVDVDLPGIGMGLDWNFQMNTPAEEHDNLNEIEKDIIRLQEYFAIPVLDEETYSLSVGKDENGNVTHMSGGTGDGDSFWIQVINAIADDACYFTFDTHTTEGNVVDTSMLPDGYGLFCVTFNGDYDENDPMVLEEMDFGEPEMVYAIDPNAYIQGLYLNEDQSQLYLLTEEDHKLYLTVIDRDTMDTLQKMQIHDWEEEHGYVHEVHMKEDFWVLWLSEGRLALLGKAENGTFNLVFCELYNHGEAGDYSMSVYAAVDWNGERLAVVDQNFPEYTFDTHYKSRSKSCGFWLLVYDDEGTMVYAGEYYSSLTPQDRSNNCNPFGMKPFTVSWKEE